MIIRITPNTTGNPPGKLADAELHFGPGLLDGLRLIGFSIWERPRAQGRTVTFPARAYSVNGERRSFALVRPASDKTDVRDATYALRTMIIAAYDAFEASPDTTTPLDYIAETDAQATYPDPPGHCPRCGSRPGDFDETCPECDTRRAQYSHGAEGVPRG